MSSRGGQEVFLRAAALDVPAPSRRFLATATLLVVVFGALAGVTGNPLLPALTIVAVAVVATVPRLRLHTLAVVALFACLMADNPNGTPGRGLYKSVLYYLGRVVYLALDKSGLAGCKLIGAEMVFLVVLPGLIAARWLAGDRIDAVRRYRAATPMLLVAIVALAWMVYNEAYGIGINGGKLNFSLMQMRTMVMLAALILLFAYAVKSDADARRVLVTLVAVGVLRAWMGIYYWLTVMRAANVNGGNGGDGWYVTQHSDSVVWVVAMLTCIAWLYQRPSLRSWLSCAVALPPMGLAVIINNRRLAIVEAVVCLTTMYCVASRPMRRRMHATLLALLPIVLLYVGAAWNARHASWAAPIQTLRSVTEQTDSSSEYRDIENYNLMFTASRHPILGWGFGHPYIERIDLMDISEAFEAFLYMPHNSVLYVFYAGGAPGFTFYWLMIGVGIFLATRLATTAHNDTQQIVAVTAVSAAAAFSLQAFGDMGIQSPVAALQVGSLFGCVGSLVARSGGWPMQRAHAAVMSESRNFSISPGEHRLRTGRVDEQDGQDRQE